MNITLRVCYLSKKESVFQIAQSEAYCTPIFVIRLYMLIYIYDSCFIFRNRQWKYVMFEWCMLKLVLFELFMDTICDE